MLAASLSHRAHPVSALLGGSGMRQIVEPTRPEVAALLKPRTGLYPSRPMASDTVAPPWEIDCPDLARERTSAIDRAMATDDPDLVPEQM